MSEKRDEWGVSCIADVEYCLSKIRLKRDTQSMQDGYLIDQRLDRLCNGKSESGYAIPEKRVLFFQSTDAQIIKTLLTKSRRLRQMIAMLPSFGCCAEEADGKWRSDDSRQRGFRKALGKTKEEDIYNFFYRPNPPEIRYLRNFNDVFEAKNLLDEELSWKYRCTPCYQMLNFQDVGEQVQNAMLRMFLENDCFRDSILLIVSPLLPNLSGYEDAVEVIDVALPRIQDIINCLEERTMKRRMQAIRIKEKNLDDKPETVKGLEQRIKKELPGDFTSVLRAEASSLLGLRFPQIENVISAMQSDTGFCCEAEAPSIKVRKGCRAIREQELEALRKAMSDLDTTLSVVDCSGEMFIACPPGYGQWLDLRMMSFKNALYARLSGERCVKGVLIAGPPGTGKSLMARYTARRLGVPLVQLKMERIKNMWQGESQKQLRTFLRRVEELSPAVLFIDEVDKVLQKNSGDNKTDTEMRSQLLDWMQSHEGAVFCFFTANDVSQLPDELIRNDRLSSRMFAFMPSAIELANILHVQLKEISEKSRQAQKESEADEEEIFFCEDFRRKLGKTDEVRADLTNLINSITPAGGDALSDWKNGPMFFTGADMKVLLDNIAIYMNHSKTFRDKHKLHGNRRAYTFEQFAEAFLACAKKAMPYGRSNFDSMVSCWMMMREKSYEDVMQADEDLPKPTDCAENAEPVIPFSLYNASYIPSEEEEAQLFNLKDWRSKSAPQIGQEHHYDYFMCKLVTECIQEIVDDQLHMKGLMKAR